MKERVKINEYRGHLQGMIEVVYQKLTRWMLYGLMCPQPIAQMKRQ